MTFILQYTNAYGERWFLENMGAQWPSRPACRLIERTTRYPEQARVFATEQEANDTLVIAGNPQGYEPLPFSTPEAGREPAEPTSLRGQENQTGKGSFT